MHGGCFPPRSRTVRALAVGFARPDPAAAAVIYLCGITGGHSPNGNYGISTAREAHSALMLAARITLAHFSVSSAMNFVKSAGEPGSAVPPNSANRAFILGSTRAAFVSLLSLSIISGAVPLGAPMPVHEANLEPWHRVGYGRSVRQYIQAVFTGYRQGAQLAYFDILDA